jgi:hypothetical protein
LGIHQITVTRIPHYLAPDYSSYNTVSDININYLIDSERKSQLEALLRTYNLTSIVNFPTRLQGNSATAIDNIFIGIAKRDSYSICPIINGLSDHVTQSITLAQ